MARAGNAVAHAGSDVTARAGDVETQANNEAEVKGAGADVDDTPPKVTVEVGGERGTKFPGRCPVGDEEKRVGGRALQTYSYMPDGERLEREIHRNGPGALEVMVAAGDNIYSVQRQTGAASGTINLTHSATEPPASIRPKVRSALSYRPWSPPRSRGRGAPLGDGRPRGVPR